MSVGKFATWNKERLKNTIDYLFCVYQNSLYIRIIYSVYCVELYVLILKTKIYFDLEFEADVEKKEEEEMIRNLRAAVHYPSFEHLDCVSAIDSESDCTKLLQIAPTAV